LYIGPQRQPQTVLLFAVNDNLFGSIFTIVVTHAAGFGTQFAGVTVGNTESVLPLGTSLEPHAGHFSQLVIDKESTAPRIVTDFHVATFTGLWANLVGIITIRAQLRMKLWSQRQPEAVALDALEPKLFLLGILAVITTGTARLFTDCIGFLSGHTEGALPFRSVSQPDASLIPFLVVNDELILFIITVGAIRNGTIAGRYL
jgi:hypothetical protein